MSELKVIGIYLIPGICLTFVLLSRGGKGSGIEDLPEAGIGLLVALMTLLWPIVAVYCLFTWVGKKIKKSISEG